MEHIKDMKQYLEKITESDTLELKESKNSLPKEFWPTYSSFSNTNGGRIILWIKEHTPQKYHYRSQISWQSGSGFMEQLIKQTESKLLRYE